MIQYTNQITIPADESEAIATLTLAFSSDPVVRWMYPEADCYLANFPAFTRAFAGLSFAHGTAHALPSANAAALWLPPGVAPEEDTIAAILQKTVREGRQAELFAMFEQMGKAHPEEPHWYLPLMGVDPARQRRGCGSAMLQSALERCDLERRPAYLEATSLENIALYRRHGFEVTGIIQAGNSPALFP